MDQIKTFYQLRVWQKSHELVLEVYKLTKSFPKYELFGIIPQLNRAASSVPANIVEGFLRDTTKEFIKFLYNARGSAGETMYFLGLAKDLGYIDERKCSEMARDYDELIRSLSALIKSLKIK